MFSNKVEKKSRKKQEYSNKKNGGPRMNFNKCNKIKRDEIAKFIFKK